MTEPRVRAVLFDLGGTLEKDGALAPGALDALDTISSMGTSEGLIDVALVSDWEDAPSDGVAASVARYLDVVRKLGILAYFEPTASHVTTSTEVGVRKPDARLFDEALRRLGLAGQRARAVLVTEDATHVAAARALGLRALRYGPGGEIATWADAPAAIRALVGPEGDDAEAAAFAHMIEETGAAAPAGAPLAPGQTHEKTADGELVRKRFSLK